MQISKLVKTAAGALAGLGLVVTAVTNLKLINVLFYTHFWIVLSISWLLSVAALWPTPDKPEIGFRSRPQRRSLKMKLSAFRWVVLSTVIFLFVGTWRYHQLNHPEPLPPGEEIYNRQEPIPIFQSGILSFPFTHRIQDDSVPQIIAMELSTDKTSYEKTSSIPG